MIAKFKGINTILKELGKGYAINVGIMGSKADDIHKIKNEKGEWVEPKEPLTNGFIGAIHEFGSVSRNIPARSFLRFPLRIGLPTKLRLNQKGMVNALLQGTFKNWLTKLGFACEEIVDHAFESSGDGSWKPLKASTIRARKKKGADKFLPLIDTGQLRRSISSEVVVDED